MKTTLGGELRSPRAEGDFRKFLQAELGRRCARNPRYSLRAFAKYLDLDHATLSQILRGKRPLTERAIRRLGFRLGVVPDAIEGYVTGTSPAGSGAPLESRLADRARTESDVVRLVTEWQHFALLELLRLPDFRPDVRWIARVLDCPPDEITLVVDRLVRLGLLVMVSRDRWVDLAGNTTTSLSEFAAGAIRTAATGANPPGARSSSSSSTTVAVSTARLAGAAQRLDKFRQELVAWLEADPARNDVYCLELKLFPLTTLNRNEGTSHG